MPTGRYLSRQAITAATMHHDRGPGRVQRVDRMVWQPDASTKITHPNGMVDARGVATRTGVLLYEDEQTGAPVRELRPASEVMDQESLATLVGAPLTIEHPGQGPDPDQGLAEVTTSNARDLTHGWVLSVEPDPSTGLVYVWVRLASQEILDAAAAGKIELSCGYTALLVDPRAPGDRADLIASIGPEPGIAANGDRYDLVQTAIRYNHLALVDAARAGPVARLHLDSKAAMKTKITIKRRDGKSTTADVPAWILDAAIAKALPAERRDADGVLSVEIEGKPPMILPEEMVSTMLAAVGMGGGGPSVPEPAMDEGDMPKPPMDPAMMADMSGEEEPMKDAKTDAAIAARVDRLVAQALARHVPTTAARIADAATASARQRAAVEHAASTVLGPRFDYAAHDEHGIAVAVLKADGSPKVQQAEALAARARKGDGVAAGRLAQLMDDALDARRDAADSSGSLGAAMFRVADSMTEPEKDEPPIWQAKRDALLAKASGRTTAA